MRCLLIGGERAGKVVDIDYGITSIEFPVAYRIGWGAIRYEVRHLEDEHGDTYLIGVSGDENPIVTLMKFYELHAKGESQ